MAESAPSGPRVCDLTGKSALVVLPDEAMGRGVVTALVRAGARVAVCLPGLGPETRALATETSLEGRVVTALELAERDAEGLEGLVDRADRDLGSLDVLVHQPSLPPARPIPELRKAEWMANVVEPVSAAFFLAQAAGRTMIEQGYGGRIVFIFPPVASTAEPPTGSTRVARRSLEATVEELALDLARYDVTVNAVLPGVLSAGGTSPTVPPHELARVPKGRAGVPADVAALVVFLASDEADYVSGSLIGVDGARRLS